MTQQTTPIACPNCNATVPEAELVAGWCESCGKHLPAWLLNALPFNRTHHTRTHGGPDSSPAHPALAGHACGLCGQTTLDAQPCYLHPNRPAADGKPVYLRCWVCSACHDRGREVRTNQLVVAWWMIAAVVLAGAAAAVIPTLGLATGTQWLLGVIVIVLLSANLIACTLYLRTAPHRQMTAWLGRLEPLLRSHLGVPGWNYFCAVCMADSIPNGATPTEPEELTQPGT